MRELSLAQKAMLNGSICPYCKNPSTIINYGRGEAGRMREVRGLDEVGFHGEPDGKIGQTGSS